MPTYGALHEIDPSRALALGDFGLGSDSPIALDYREDAVNPSVMYLRSSYNERGKQTSWVRCADSFDDFVTILGLA
jgi:hypothetical protein